MVENQPIRGAGFSMPGTKTTERKITSEEEHPYITPFSLTQEIEAAD